MTISKMFAAICFAGIFLVSACSKTGSKPDEPSNEPLSVNARLIDPIDPCPPGTHPVLSYEFNEFRFKRPITNCTSGFWFCTTDGQWVITCVPNNMARTARIENRTAYIWAEVEDTYAILHFPLALKDDPDYSSTDLATFSVDSEYEIYPGIILARGSYTVEESSTELLVTVDLKE